MSGWIMDRIVARAIPLDVEDPAQERFAEEAAENAIRQVVMISGIAGLVADLTQKLQATRAAATPDRSAHFPKPARPSSIPVSAERRLAYGCGDGRSVRDPATCNATIPAAPEVTPSEPDTYYCGDGRSVPNPADCGAAVVPPPPG
jgi:hypothetical protein